MACLALSFPDELDFEGLFFLLASANFFCSASLFSASLFLCSASLFSASLFLFSASVEEGKGKVPPRGSLGFLWVWSATSRGRPPDGRLALPVEARDSSCERGVEEERDGRDASDVDGVAAREDAQEELRGEVEQEQVGGRRRVWRGSGGGGGARRRERRGG